MKGYSRRTRPVKDHTHHINITVQMILTQVVDLVRKHFQHQLHSSFYTARQHGKTSNSFYNLIIDCVKLISLFGLQNEKEQTLTTQVWLFEVS